MNNSVKSLKPQTDCQQLFSQTINFSSRSSLNNSQNHKRTFSLNGKDNNSGNKNSKSGFKIFKKSSQSSTIQNEDGDNSFFENSFCGSQNNQEILKNSFKNQQNTSILELENISHNMPSTIPQNKSSNTLNVEINSFNDNLRSPCSNYEQVFKQIDLSYYQSQISNVQTRVQSINDINIKESAEFGGNLKNKIGEVNGKKMKNSPLNNIKSQNNSFQSKQYSHNNEKENFPIVNMQKEDKNATISKILERMNGRFEDLEQKMNRLIQHNSNNSKNQQTNIYNSSSNQNNIEENNKVDSKNKQIEINILSKLLDRIEKIEQRMNNYDAGFTNYKKQIESNLNDFQILIQKSVSQFMDRSEQIEKKMGIVSNKIANDQAIKQNYEVIIERLNKINHDFNERFLMVESQTNRKEEQITMEVYNQQERLTIIEKEVFKLLKTFGDNQDKNSGYKWLSDEIVYIKNRQVQFLSMLMEISTLVGLK